MKLTPNIGWLDKLVRYALSVILITLHLAGTVTGSIGLIALVLAGLLLATGLFRFCPIYLAFGFTTSKSEDKARGKYE